MLAPAPRTATWPAESDGPELETIIADQWKTIAAQEVLLHDFQTVLNAAQNPQPTSAPTGTGTASNSTSLTVAAAAGGAIVNGATIMGGTVPTGTTILGQISGTTGGNGVYLTSAALNLSSVPLTFKPPPPATTWPLPQDPATLLTIAQQQTAILRLQSSLMQNYVDLLNTSETSPT